MKIAFSFSPFNSIFLFAAGVALVGAFMLQMLPASHTVSLSAPSAQVSEARLAPGAESLLKQTARHISKLMGGASVGGFPGFEPPDDDKRYKDKIRNQSYNGGSLGIAVINDIRAIRCPYQLW